MVVFTTQSGLIGGEAAGEGEGLLFVCVGEGVCVVMVGMVAGEGGG